MFVYVKHTYHYLLYVIINKAFNLFKITFFRNYKLGISPDFLPLFKFRICSTFTKT